MCTATNKKIVEEVVYDFVQQGRMFTAFDVTREAKTRGATERHNHMKNSVHSMQEYLEDHGYERKLIDVGMASKPWLYYPDHLDPDDYVTDNNVMKSTTAPLVKSNKKIRTVKSDRKGRISVGSTILNKASMYSGDKVGIRVEANEVIIDSDPKKTDVVLSVHNDGRVKINPHSWTKVNRAHSGVKQKRFQVEVEAHSVRLKPL